MWSYRRDEETGRWLSSWPLDRGASQPSAEQPAEWAGMIVIELDGPWDHHQLACRPTRRVADLTTG